MPTTLSASFIASASFEELRDNEEAAQRTLGSPAAYVGELIGCVASVDHIVYLAVTWPMESASHPEFWKKFDAYPPSPSDWLRFLASIRFATLTRAQAIMIKHCWRRTTAPHRDWFDAAITLRHIDDRPITTVVAQLHTVCLEKLES